MERALTPDQVADLVQLSAEAVRRAVRRGELRASRVCGRLRIMPADVEAWMAASTVAPSPRRAPAEASAPRPLRRSASGSKVLELMELHADDRP